MTETGWFAECLLWIESLAGPGHQSIKDPNSGPNLAMARRILPAMGGLVEEGVSLPTAQARAGSMI
jgi:hypothetical protein